MTVEERLDNLERSSRRWRVAAVVLGLVLVSVVAMGQVRGVPDLIRAREFQVVNEKGVPVVLLRSSVFGGWIRTNTNRGQELFGVATNDAGRCLVDISNGKGQTLVSLTSTDKGEGAVATYNGKGHKLVKFAATEYGEGGVTTYNGKGHKLFELTARDDGSGMLVVNNDRGWTLVQLRSTDKGEGAVVVYDPSGRHASHALLPRR